MQIELRAIASVKPYENNPRINDSAVDAVAASIKEFGFRQPIVVDEAGVIIVGHTRYKAALKLGLEVVPVHVAVGLSPAQAKAYRIADNQTAALSQFDDDRLSIELAELQGMGFDLELTGFSGDELLRLLDAPPAQEDPGPQIDRAAELQKKWQTNSGQLWVIPSKTVPPRRVVTCPDCDCENEL